MELFFKILLSPMTFAIGFLWPLFTQSIIALEWLPAGWTAVAVGATVAISFGLMAQLRGSWIWVR